MEQVNDSEVSDSQARHTPGPVGRLERVVTEMPPLKHWDGESEFHPSKSEVVKWLFEQPEVAQWLFDYVKHKKLIRFDSKARTWAGVGPSVSLRKRPGSGGPLPWREDWPPENVVMSCLDDEEPQTMGAIRTQLRRLGHTVGHWQSYHILSALARRGRAAQSPTGWVAVFPKDIPVEPAAPAPTPIVEDV